MKVVVAHNRYSSAQPSGENIMVDAEIAQLTAAGVQVLPLLHSSDEIGALPAGRKALLPLAPIYAPAAQRELRHLIREHRPDILHLHNPYPLISPWIVRTAHAHGLPVVQTVHNYRQVCASGVYFRDGHICRDCRGRAVALPAIRHRCYRGSAAQSVVMATALAAHRGTWRSVDRYIALTAAIAEHLRDYGIPEERIVVKPNAVTDPGACGPLGEGFLFIGRLTEEKGLRLLLEAWSRHPEGSLGSLRIVGDGPLRVEAEAAAARRGDVLFLGPRDATSKWEQFRAAAVVVACSTWEDVLPTVVIEALATGRPVLGTALGGIPYLVGGAGWTVPADPASLSAALPVARDGAAALAAAARGRYLDTFTPDRVTARLVEVYRSVTSQAARPGRRSD
jgi:glycosyltransferase involved in cell wall biosynthesis